MKILRTFVPVAGSVGDRDWTDSNSKFPPFSGNRESTETDRTTGVFPHFFLIQDRDRKIGGRESSTLMPRQYLIIPWHAKPRLL